MTTTPRDRRRGRRGPASSAPSGSSRAASTARSAPSGRSAGRRSSSSAARAPYVWDADGRRYIDYIGALGSGDPRSRPSGGHRGDRRRRPRDGLALGATNPLEIELGEAIRARDAVDGAAALHLVGHRGRHERAAAGPGGHRPRPRRQVRRRLPRPRGRPARRGRLRASRRRRIPGSAGVPDAVAARRSCCRTTTSRRSTRAFAAHAGRIAAVIVEPVAANAGVIAPQPGLPRAPPRDDRAPTAPS